MFFDKRPGFLKKLYGMYSVIILKMCDTRAEMDLLIKKMRKLTAGVEEKITQQAKCEDVMTNSRAPEDMFDKLKEYRIEEKRNR